MSSKSNFIASPKGSDIPVLPPTIERGLVVFKAEDISALLDRAKRNNILRARICTHRSADAQVQEMLIAFWKESYIHPHRHLGKSESFHLIEGELSVVFFDDLGVETDRIELSTFDRSKPIYFRSERADWHTVLIESEYAFIHETTAGPYDDESKLLASWAPREEDSERVHEFLQSLRTAT